MLAQFETQLQSWIALLEAKLTELGVGGFVVNVLLNGFVCFFGYRFYRIVLTIFGFGLGTLAGYGVLSTYTTLQEPVKWIIAIVIGIVFALVAYTLYKLAVFVLAAIVFFAILYAILTGANLDSTMALVISGIVGVIGGFLSIRFMKEILIVATGFGGGTGAMKVLCSIAGVQNSTVILVLGLVLSALGIWFQFTNCKKLK